MSRARTRSAARSSESWSTGFSAIVMRAGGGGARGRAAYRAGATTASRRPSSRNSSPASRVRSAASTAATAASASSSVSTRSWSASWPPIHDARWRVSSIRSSSPPERYAFALASSSGARARRGASRARRGSRRGPPAGASGSTPAETSKRAGVGVVHEARRHVIGEAQLLPDRQEEPARHPVAEDGVEHRQAHASGWSRRSPGTPRTSCACDASRVPEQEALARRQRRRGGRSRGSRRCRCRTPSPARPTASSWPTSPASATTVFAGRYIVRQKSRIVAAGSARMSSSSPQISRPSGPSPNIACWNRIWAYSAGSSRYERISSTITARSPSISSSASRGRTMSSPRTSIARVASRRGTRTQ